MSAPSSSRSRLRGYLEFLAGVLYLFVARSLAHHAAQGLATDNWSPLLEQLMLVFLLLVGYAGMGLWSDRQKTPISEQGLPRRSGFSRESGMGVAFGWALVVICVLAMAMFGGIAIAVTPQLSSWGWLTVDALYFAFFALAEEIAFRGYAFQAFVRAVGPIGATLGFAAICAILQQALPGSSHASFAVALALTVVLSSAYLRTRALWVSWGINFGWKASQALLFGLAVRGVAGNSPVVQGDPMGSFWLTGGAFGLDGSWLAFFVLLAAIPFVFRMTRDLNYRYNAPVLVPGGIPVDIEGAARMQHEAAMGSAAPAPPALVQLSSSSPMQESRPPALAEDRANDSR
jgi:uncharacterized protein